ncbi:MAG: glycosyltransferase family 4 protein [Candidatus Latescibacteria bacterium]|nr:glycosyltransferase family 4 protein [Candidatus Latescibacterota bacterium]
MRFNHRCLRIGVDGVLIRKQGKGVSRFLVSFLQAFAAYEQSTVELVVFVNRDAELPTLPHHYRIHYVPVRVTKQLIWDLWGFDRWLKKTQVDVVFTLADRVRVSRTYVVYLFEIPDYRIALNCRTAGVYQRVSDRITRWCFPRSLRNAAHVATSSVATKNDVIRQYGVPEQKLSVVYSAPDPLFCPCSDVKKIEAIRVRYNAREGYLLHFSSNNDPRDNTGTVLQAFAVSLERLKHSKKLLIGGVRHLESFGWGKLLHDLGLEELVVFTGFTTGTDLVELYQAADVYVDPSLYEGFGFQVVEAMACGTPVITSNVTSLSEVVGDAGILLPPTDTEAFANNLVRVLSDEDLWQSMRHKGLAQVKRFSWQKVVYDVVDTIENVL